MLYIKNGMRVAPTIREIGHSVLKTPYLDELASRGTRFRAAYSACPQCVPARRTLLTGREFFFDLVNDPGETIELSIFPDFARQIAVWRERLVERLSNRHEGFVKDGRLTQVEGPPKMFSSRIIDAKRAWCNTLGVNDSDTL